MKKHDNRRSRQEKNYTMDRNGGYGVNLYRDTRKGKIAGVCAGIADHLNIDPFLIRLLFFFGLFMSGGAMFWAYIVAWIALAPRSDDHYEEVLEYDENIRAYRAKNIFNYKQRPTVRMRSACDRLNKLSRRIEEMERYVTSKKYHLNEEFADLNRK